uniref:Transmembrane protein n=1 Tax=Tanacetum cinerariifolium TaxID=118510 RepID=A0A699JTK5_TANCI|nr:hypothetical protein [Tanacetum cinerariifolium]
MTHKKNLTHGGLDEDGDVDLDEVVTRSRVLQLGGRKRKSFYASVRIVVVNVFVVIEIIVVVHLFDI